MKLRTGMKSKIDLASTAAWLVLLLLGQTAAAQSPEREAAVFDVRGVPLSEALVRLAQARSLKLAYAPELVAGRTSNCVTRSLVVAEALRCVLGGSGLYAESLPNGVYVIRKQGAAPGSDSLATRGTGTISGTVRAQPSGEILVGAHVRVVGTQLGAVSRSDGTFRITQVPAGLHDLEVSMLGFRARYRRVHVPADDGVRVEVGLNETTIALDEVVVASRQQTFLSSLSNALDADFQGVRVGAVSVGLLVSASSKKVTGVQVSGLGSLAGDSLRGIQVGALFNATGGAANGAQFGGILNTIDGDLDGAQFGGIANVAMRDVRGVQFGGIANVARDVQGVQAGGIANVTRGKMNGIQVAGIFNTVGGPARVTQLGGLFNTAASRLQGVQVAGLWNVTGETLEGHQFAGIANVARRSVRATQLAGIVNVSGGPVQVQASGIVNVAGRVRALQLGLFNFARANDGVPIGLFSYVGDVGLKFDVWTDETGLASVAVRSGNRRISNFLGFSAHPSRVRFGRGPVVGLGTEFDVARRAYGSVDLLHYGLVDRSWENWAGLTRLRLMLGWKLNDFAAVFGGPALNLLLSDEPAGDVVAPWLMESGRWVGTHYAVWPGFSFGLRVSTRR